MLLLCSNFHFFIDFTVLRRYRYSSIVICFSEHFFCIVNDPVDFYFLYSKDGESGDRYTEKVLHWLLIICINVDIIIN